MTRKAFGLRAPGVGTHPEIAYAIFAAFMPIKDATCRLKVYEIQIRRSEITLIVEGPSPLKVDPDTAEYGDWLKSTTATLKRILTTALREGRTKSMLSVRT